MKRVILEILISLALTTVLCGCGGQKVEEQKEEKTPERRISSIVYYNITGKIQREDFCEYDSAGNASVGSQVVYTYNDRGKLTNIKREAGGPGYDKDIEAYFFMGENCTQKIIFNENGSSSEVYYWKYYDDGSVKSETHTVMLTPSTKNEELKEYDEDGILRRLTVTTPEGYTYTDYIYDEETGLLTEENSFSSQTGKKADYEPENELYYSYGEDLKIIKTVKKDRDGIPLENTSFEYDDAGNPVMEKLFYGGEPDENNLISKKTKEFDALGELIFESETDRNGNGSSMEYRYDSNGNVIRKTERSFGESNSETVTETDYDIHNNPIMQTVSLNGGPKLTEFECSYEYYDSGAVKVCTYYK